MPEVEEPPTIISINSPIPVSVVEPIPSLETPVIGKLSYDGSETNICGLLYPVPPLTTLKESVPPAPTLGVAVICAGVPEWPSSKTDTPIETNPLYPDPRLSVVPSPTDTIDPPAPTTAVTEAPTRGANPSPGVDPNETIIPPLGVSFWFISESELTYSRILSGLVIPENSIVVIPTPSEIS